MIGFEKRARRHAAGGIAMFHAAHAVAHNSDETSMGEKLFVVRIAEAERILLRAAVSDVLGVSRQKTHAIRSDGAESGHYIEADGSGVLCPSSPSDVDTSR